MPRAALVLLLLAAPAAAQVTTPVPVVPPTPQTRPTPPFDQPGYRLGNIGPGFSVDLGNLNLDLSRIQSNIDLNVNDALAWRTSSLDGLGSTLSNWSTDGNFTGLTSGSVTAPPPWAKDDPADSLYRAARESLNHGDYRKAASQFDDITKRFPKSVYVKDAPYWRAFALYRIGGTPELTEALTVLDKWRADNPAPVKSTSSRNSSSNARAYTTSIAWSEDSGRPDVDGLSARIAGVLATRGMADNAAVKRALAARGDACDSEDQSVKAEALSAVMQSSPEQGRALAAKILARRDECSVPLRRNALLVLARKHDASTVSALAGAAKNDPSASIRSDAIDWLGGEPADESVAALEELSKSTDANVQREAVRALANNTNPRARALIHSYVERADVSEALRVSALGGYGRGTTSAEDAAWLRGLYPKSTLRVQERIVAILTRVGGDTNQQWLLALARKEDEPSSVRSAILDQLGRTMDITTLTKFYDTASNRSMRESIISLLGSRTEPEAVDKLIEIVKNGTDPNIRRSAIGVLAKSKDPRAVKLLLDLVDK